MKKIIVLLAMVVSGLFGYETSFAQGWYIKDSGQCLPAATNPPRIQPSRYGRCFSGPAELIRYLKKPDDGKVFWDVSFSDVRGEDGKPVQVTVSWSDIPGGEKFPNTYYRLERCKQLLNSKKAEERERERREQKKLKEYE